MIKLSKNPRQIIQIKNPNIIKRYLLLITTTNYKDDSFTIHNRHWMTKSRLGGITNNMQRLPLSTMQLSLAILFISEVKLENIHLIWYFSILVLSTKGNNPIKLYLALYVALEIICVHDFVKGYSFACFGLVAHAPRDYCRSVYALHVQRNEVDLVWVLLFLVYSAVYDEHVRVNCTCVGSNSKIPFNLAPFFLLDVKCINLGIICSFFKLNIKRHTSNKDHIIFKDLASVVTSGYRW